jgi:hypothetical protein
VIDITSVQPAHHPRLKLFLSADIIGSTAYKQPFDLTKDPTEAEKWADIIQGFYRTIASSFTQVRWGELQTIVASVEARHKSSVNPERLGRAPIFWKTIGDEVVFWKQLTDDSQIWLTLGCWLRTIQDVRDYFGRENIDLDIKSTAWIAGFPVRNKALLSSLDSLPENTSDGLSVFYKSTEDTGTEKFATIVDFIGPGIDVGFRISQFSSSKKMSISLDCAYLLAETKDVGEAIDLALTKHREALLPDKTGAVTGDNTGYVERLKPFVSGDEPLKGVLGGINYPKFWIDTIKHGSLDAAKEVFYRKHRVQMDNKELLDYCTKFYDDRGRYISKPFINSSDSKTAANITDSYREHWKHVSRSK